MTSYQSSPKILKVCIPTFSYFPNFADIFTGSKKLELLQWLSKIPYSKHHESIRNGRQEGSGLWLFENPQYVQWKKTRSSSLLWIHGNRKRFSAGDTPVTAESPDLFAAGSGKSKLM